MNAGSEEMEEEMKEEKLSNKWKNSHPGILVLMHVNLTNNRRKCQNNTYNCFVQILWISFSQVLPLLCIKYFRAKL